MTGGDPPRAHGPIGERELIQRVRRGGGRLPPGVLTGIGDDTAVLALDGGPTLLATTDLLIEDVHFRRPAASPRDIGWKSLAVNLSDIAAMGGRPRYALVALALPRRTDWADVEAFYAGLREAGEPYGVVVVGGDTSGSPGGWFVNVTVLGDHPGAARLRSSARPGHAVAVTGTLGRSAAGLALLEAQRKGLAVPDTGADAEECIAAHLRPHARVTEGQWLGEAAGVHAMMDCSDGLAADLERISEESGVGVRVALDRLPVAPAARAVARALGGDPDAWAAAGGEDYELILSCEPDAAPTLVQGLREATGTPLTLIGEVLATPGVVWVGVDGRPAAVRPGYEHFRS
jgi:thiamine-monophosphate kinase